ncbi:hypothetical protein E2C01_032186 [Portunus trituberculatus]|uniref:Uncharacterized protein n=1 Tax=Portunus trituberculatus TaxID=210409 RepID=A0A5B7EZ10_PORTR|nr:hypothetical protein [Portunus trituberculatus]
MMPGLCPSCAVSGAGGMRAKVDKGAGRGEESSCRHAAGRASTPPLARFIHKKRSFICAGL